MLFISGSVNGSYNQDNQTKMGLIMKKIFLFTSILFSASLSAEQNIQVNSITVHNLSETSKQVWVSGEPYQIETDSSLVVPCFPGESIYVQSVKNTNIVSCGETEAIDNED